MWQGLRPPQLPGSQPKASTSSKNAPQPAARPRRSRVKTSVIAPPPAPKQREQVALQTPSSSGPIALVSSAAQTAAAAAATTVLSTRDYAVALLTNWYSAYGQPRGALEAEKVLQEAAEQERRREAAAPPVSIEHFLAPVGAYELKHMRKLSALCSLTYLLHRVTPRGLMRRHGLELVSTSWTCEREMYEHTRSAQEVADEGDGMATSIGDLLLRAGRGFPSAPTAPGPDQAAGNNIVPSSSQVAAAVQPAQRKAWVSPTDLVAAKLADAAATAAAAASALPLASAASAAAGLYAGLASRLGQAGGPTPSQAELRQQVGASTSAAALAAATSAAAVAVSTQTPASQVCPSDWFAADDPHSGTRYFVIQGSDTIDHWKLNLTFDPVVFEDPRLGARVHRGVYEAAKVLYDRLLPLVYEHIESSPFAKVCFTGHSIGGSLGTLLMLMFVRRGVLRPQQIAPNYTFGAPGVFCQCEPKPEAPSPALLSSGDSWLPTPPSTFAFPLLPGSGASSSSSSSAAGTSKGGAGSGSASASADTGCCGSADCADGHICAGRNLLSVLGLGDDLVRNVVMHRDIVPRAFTCDYSLVADILKSWGASFREHGCLAHPGRKHMYYFTGRMIVLQPDTWHWFVLDGEPYHPMLPPGPGAYLLTEDAQQVALGTHGRVGALAQGALSVVQQAASKAASAAGVRRGGGGPAPAAKAPAAAPGSPAGATAVPSVSVALAVAAAANAPLPPGASGGASSTAVAISTALQPLRAASVPAAVEALMDNPHPLNILADPGAYMDRGSISRYHNPENYTSTMGRLVFLARSRDGVLPAWLNNPLARVRAALRAGAVGAAVGGLALSQGAEQEEEAVHLGSQRDAIFQLSGARGGGGGGSSAAEAGDALRPYDSSESDGYLPSPFEVLRRAVDPGHH